ncbi:hypothetical protein [Kribbella italica]|uniref:Alpha amylase inhibitor n=1 Tax=Kribbella italica TaxID=1540520 RepID=A0A7W9MW49_9ACTN|nr:hypothetical protein [Kribbella italica]MBB5838499.1 hypothetical protein [Kribbella italica]
MNTTLRAALVVTGLAASALTVTAPGASASTTTAPAVSTSATAASPCVPRNWGPTFFTVSCYTRATGNQYRAVVRCSNNALYFGPWRYHTLELTNRSRANCPAGTTRLPVGHGYQTRIYT